MPKKYSIAEARNQLAKLVHHVEDGAPVELTRRGKPVAVMVSHTEYQRLTAPSRSFWEACSDFRSQYDVEALGLDPDALLSGTRDASPGESFSW